MFETVFSAPNFKIFAAGDMRDGSGRSSSSSSPSSNPGHED